MTRKGLIQRETNQPINEQICWVATPPPGKKKTHLIGKILGL